MPRNQARNADAHEQADLDLASPARRPRGRWPALPPTAKIQLPVRVRSRIQVASATKTIHHSTVILSVHEAER